MAVQAHLAELSDKHDRLDQRIAEELTRPLSDTVKLTELKRKKLMLKEQIHKLQRVGAN